MWYVFGFILTIFGSVLQGFMLLKCGHGLWFRSEYQTSRLHKQWELQWRAVL